MKATVFDIKRSSLEDGPGIRTTIFFKGCNLNCFWCHNPEGKSMKSQRAYYKSKCIHCGVCKKFSGIPDEEIVLRCPTKAKRLYGKEYEIEELFNIILLDKDFYEASGGGVTFSGGECMLQVDFVRELSQLCKNNGISVAVDTAGCVDYTGFEEILPYTDIFLYDIKCLNADLHKRGTGRDNVLILKNLERLIKTDKKIIIRVPVIPNFNDNEELENIKVFCKSRNLSLELLPYHNYGVDKREALLNSWDKNE